VYCQVGRTVHLEVKRRVFYLWSSIVEEVLQAVDKTGAENIDYVTFVPDGEPTLDLMLGREIRGVKEALDVRVAVLTNGSLLHLEDVREDLMDADLVSVKVDAVSEPVYRRVNRPHPSLSLEKVLDGMREFSESFDGELLTETMLVSGLNDEAEELKAVAEYIASLKPSKAYIAVPIRPPTEGWVKPPDERVVTMAYKIFEKLLPGRVELLIGYEGESFKGLSGDPIDDILSITAVHPLRLDYAYRLLGRLYADPEGVVRKLVRDEKVALVEYGGHRFIVRRVGRRVGVS